MLNTLISILVAFSFIIISQIYPVNIVPTILAAIMALAGIAAWASVTIVHATALIPIQKLEQKLLPLLTHRYRHDKPLQMTTSLIYLFVLLSFAAGGALLAFNFPNTFWIFPAWLVTLGVTLDLFRDLSKRVATLLNPFQGVSILIEESKNASLSNDEGELRNNLNALTETAFQAIDKNKIAIAADALSAFPAIMQPFFSSKRSISSGIETQTASRDETNYTIFYLFQRLSLIYDLTLTKQLEFFAQQIITAIGKIIIYAAKCDLSLATYPIHMLGAFSTKAQNQGMYAVATMATSTLIEVSKAIVNEVDLTYAELVTPFQAIINNIDTLEKNNFKRDKSISVRTLMLPLQDLRLLFMTPKVANHKDTPAVLAQIDDALSEFAALEQVMMQKGKG